MPVGKSLSLERLSKAWLPLSHQHFAPVLMREIGPPLVQIAVAGVREGITSGVSPDGRPYKALKHGRPDGSGGRPLNRSGALAAAVRATVTQNQLELEASHPGATTHQYGATIKPRNKEWLTVPVTPEADRQKSARSFPRALFFVQSRLANTGLLCERGPNGLIIHYVLKKEIHVVARPFLGFSTKTELEIVRLAADKGRDIVARTLEGAR